VPLPREIEYWENISQQCYKDGKFWDNVWKRPYQIRKLLKYDWFGKKVLEIGVGNGVIAGTLQALNGSHWDYTGTELSANFRKCAKELFNVTNVVEADVRELPGTGYQRIIALDSLEHVKPDHRQAGYNKIYEVADKGCLLFIHLSRSESLHDKEFDHPFGLRDFMRLEEVGFTLDSYEAYQCITNDMTMDYAFVVFKK
jgi:ubiquinone/menaquinone biosynthesis C-methylase UbiE